MILTAAALLFDWHGDRLFDFGFSLTLPFWVTAAATIAVGYRIVPLLRWWKTGQVIRDDGPQAHLKKAGTPTMGGIFFVPTGILLALLWAEISPAVQPIDTEPLLAVCGITLAYGFVGWLDDWQVLRQKSNKGISPKMKLALQIGFAIAFCAWLSLRTGGAAMAIALPFGMTLSLGIGFWFLAVFVLTAESNSTNLTDGLDGLMGGTGAIALLGLGAIVATTYPSLALFCACLSGGCYGFLAYNRNPAKVFMGDTGSLALGGALAGVGIVANVLFPLLILSGIFFVEAVSVMAQVGYYKATKNEAGVGKRLFKMSPFHHHLELSGWSELQVVAAFYVVGGVLAVLALLVR